jgi:hypothetical protein
MRKSRIIILSVILCCMLSGCSMKNSVKNQTIDSAAPSCTVAPSCAAAPSRIAVRAGEGIDRRAEKDSAFLQAGFEAWEKTEATTALKQALMMNLPIFEVSMEKDNTVSDYFRVYSLNNADSFMGISLMQKLIPDRYAIVDMDHNTTPEVIVALTTGYDGFYLLLRYYEGSVYGYPYEYRGLQMPKQDGTFLASSGAADNMIMELSFDGLGLMENCLAFSKLDTDGISYYIADKEVSEQAYIEFSNKFDRNKEVEWYLFPSELRAGYIGEKLFHVEFDAITEPVEKTLERYYSTQEVSTVFSHSSRIPKSLSDLIIEEMKKETEEEAFSSLKVGERISQQEFSKLTGVEIMEWESVAAVRIDADNDGIQDLFGMCYWGGTGGFSSMILYRGTENEGYKETCSAEGIYQDYSFLSYQGKNYLLMKDFDYNTKYFSGYTLYLYENGVLADGMIFRFFVNDYKMRIMHENTIFSGMGRIKNTLCNKELPDLLYSNDGILVGTAERIDETDSSDYRYSCDIDNNGIEERYNKYMWFPSNMGTVMECFYDFEVSKVLQDLCNRLAAEVGEGRLYTFWIDRIEDSNVIYLFYGNNLDYSLYAYLLEEKK